MVDDGAGNLGPSRRCQIDSKCADFDRLPEAMGGHRIANEVVDFVGKIPIEPGVGRTRGYAVNPNTVVPHHDTEVPSEVIESRFRSVIRRHGIDAGIADALTPNR